MYPSDDYPVLLHFVTHAVNLLDVGEDHLRVQSVVWNHSFHVIGSQEIRNTRVPPKIKSYLINPEQSLAQCLKITEKSLVQNCQPSQLPSHTFSWLKMPKVVPNLIQTRHFEYFSNNVQSDYSLLMDLTLRSWMPSRSFFFDFHHWSWRSRKLEGKNNGSARKKLRHWPTRRWNFQSWRPEKIRFIIECIIGAKLFYLHNFLFGTDTRWEWLPFGVTSFWYHRNLKKASWYLVPRQHRREWPCHPV